MVWPETSASTASEMATQYQQRAGASPVPIPANVEGPASEAWQGIAIETLKLVNGLTSLEELGVNPRTYHPAEYKTIGDFLDRISTDFVNLLNELLGATRKPIRLIVAFVSESGKGGVLGDLTSSARYGLLDADRLLSATPNSVIGKWWAQRSGLLVQTIVRLDARAVFVAPSLVVPIIRRYGVEKAADILDALGFKPKPPSEISVYFTRSEFGRVLQRADSPTAEIRGNPAHDARVAYELLGAEFGFGSGNDKKLNRAVGDFLSQAQSSLGDVVVEERLDSLPLIPDLAVNGPDEATCVELHWRSGDYLVNAHRSAVAQYILGKLKSYAVESGWAMG